jgi:hypothetical protein
VPKRLGLALLPISIEGASDKTYPTIPSVHKLRRE